MTRTDAVIQPRQSNTWGALSLDHVYEFMGGMNLAVRNVTGKDPDAYLSDYRNRNNARMQEVGRPAQLILLLRLCKIRMAGMS